MNHYELLVIIESGLTEDQTNATIENVNKILTSLNATIESTEKWGTRKLAYPINYKNEGFYVLIKLTAPSDCPNNAEKILNITANVVRTMFERV